MLRLIKNHQDMFNHDEFFFDGIEAKITQASDSNDCFLIKNKEIL